jgi:putative transposase
MEEASTAAKTRARQAQVVGLKIALDLDQKTEAVLDGQSKIASWLWNDLLETSNATLARVIAANEAGNPVDLQDIYFLYGRRNLRNHMVGMKETSPWLKCLHSSVSKNVALRLSRAIRDTRSGMHKKKLGWPNFNQWGWAWFSLEYDEPHKGYSFSPGLIILSLGRDKNKKRLSVELPLHEPLPTFANNGSIRALRIVKEYGIYYAVLTVSRQIVAQKPLPKAPKMIALDPGHENPLTGFDSDGGVIEIKRPLYFKRLDDQIQEVQAKRDHCRKKSLKLTTHESGKDYWVPSRRWRFYNEILQKLRLRRREQTKRWSYQVANRLFSEYDLVSMGDYAPRGNGRSRGERRSMNNRSLIGDFKRTLAWVATRSGKQFVVWNERNSTRTCHGCDYKLPYSIDPTFRAWFCPACGAHNHRDANAAQNGLDRTKAIVQLPCSGHQEISSWRTWRLTEAGITQVVSTPESVFVGLKTLGLTPSNPTASVIADHQNLIID